MSVRIILDSTSDLRDSLMGRFPKVPLHLHFGEEEYLDGVTIDHKTFYQKLIESDVLPKTSQATPTEFDEEFRKTVEQGDTAVVITVAAKLSGTYQSAVIAADDYPDQIYVVDSENAAIGSGILAEYALKLAEEGKSAKEIAQILEVQKKRVRIIALLDTLEYLKKGGRISAAAAFAGGLLSIKPVIALYDGEIKVLGKARGSKQGNNLLVQEINKAGGVDFSMPVLLGYSGLSNALLLKYIEDSKALWEQSAEELEYAQIGSVIGTHAGPGAIAAAFFKAE